MRDLTNREKNEKHLTQEADKIQEQLTIIEQINAVLAQINVLTARLQGTN